MISGIEPDFLEYYTRELLYMRETMQEFAQVHPKVARRLGIQNGEIGDPHVERLVEAFSWESARSQIRIDAAFPEFTQRLLAGVYPNYTRPTPAMSVARLFPDPQKEIPANGFLFKEGSVLASARIPRDERTLGMFVNSQDVMLWPLELVHAKATGIPPDMVSLQSRLPAYRQVKGALRLRFRTTGDCQVDELENLDRLPIYLAGDEALASHLFEWIHAGALATVIGAPGSFGESQAPLSFVRDNAVVHEAMEPGQGTLPLYWSKFHGHNLLHEYFACPARFYFFTLTQLHKELRKVQSNEVEIVILMAQEPGELAHRIEASQFALFCTPVVNLFRRKVRMQELSFKDDEALLMPDAARERDYEVFGVEHLYAFAQRGSKKLEFLPCDAALREDEGDQGCYYSLRREVIMPLGGKKRQYGTHLPYTPSRLYASLRDMQNRPYPGMKFAEMWLWLTNADLPCLLERNGKTDLEPLTQTPVASVGLLRPFSMPWPALARGDNAWKLFSLLNLHASPFVIQNGKNAADLLSDRLQIFVLPGNTACRRNIDSIVDFKVGPTEGMMPRAAGETQPRPGRMIGVQLTVDESVLEGFSPYLFGLVLERWVTRLVSQWSATKLTLHSVQRGKIAEWPAREGTRSVF